MDHNFNLAFMFLFSLYPSLMTQWKDTNKVNLRHREMLLTLQLSQTCTHTLTPHWSMPISAHTKQTTVLLSFFFLFLSKDLLILIWVTKTHIPGWLKRTDTLSHTHISNKLFMFLPLNQTVSSSRAGMSPGTEEMSDVNPCYNSAEATTWEGIHLLYSVLMGNQS